MDLVAFLVNFQFFFTFLVAHYLKITPLKTVLKNLALLLACGCFVRPTQQAHMWVKPKAVL